MQENYLIDIDIELLSERKVLFEWGYDFAGDGGCACEKYYICMYKKKIYTDLNVLH